MSTISIGALTSAFIGGAELFGKQVVSWDLRNKCIQVRTNVNTPQAMSKLSADGVPRPYRIDDDFTGMTVTARELVAYQSKMDIQIDPEDLRNTYLANPPIDALGNVVSFENFCVSQASKQFLDNINNSSLYLGVRNGAGTTASDLVNGWGTIIAAEIVAATLTPVVTGAVTPANAVTQVELVSDAVPNWMREYPGGYCILVSYDVLNKYRKHYRTLNGFGFNKNERNQYQLDGVNAQLIPCSFMGTSQRIIATVDGNLVFGTDIEQVSMHPTPYLNTLKTRLMMPVGCQIRDLDAIVVNDQA